MPAGRPGPYPRPLTGPGVFLSLSYPSFPVPSHPTTRSTYTVKSDEPPTTVRLSQLTPGESFTLMSDRYRVFTLINIPSPDIRTDVLNVLGHPANAFLVFCHRSQEISVFRPNEDVIQVTPVHVTVTHTPVSTE